MIRCRRTTSGRPDLEVGGRLFIDVLARRTAADLAPLLVELAPDVVVYEQFEFGAAVAAHAAGIPAVCHSLSPRMPDEAIRIVAGEPARPAVGRARVSPGSFDVFTGDVYLDIFPTVLQQPSFLTDPARSGDATDPVRRTGGRPAGVGRPPQPAAQPSARVPDPRHGRGDRRGVAPGRRGPATLDADILRGARLRRRRRSSATCRRTFTSRRSSTSRRCSPTPISSCTTAAAARSSGRWRHGTAQLLLPKGADQFFNADAMARAGLASVLEPSQVTPDAVVDARQSGAGRSTPRRRRRPPTRSPRCHTPPTCSTASWSAVHAMRRRSAVLSV